MDTRTALILLLIATLLIHLAEEIKTGFRKRLPLGEIPLLLFVGINVVIYAFCSTTLEGSISLEVSQLPYCYCLQDA
jgi:hypothetical protein